MSVEVAALRVGGSVAQLAVGRWLAGRSSRDGAGKDLVELIKTGFPDEIKRRRVQRQFEGIADSVAERLLTFAGHEFGGLNDGDRLAALDEVVRTLDRADLSDDALFAADADPVKLARGLRKRLPAGSPPAPSTRPKASRTMTSSPAVTWPRSASPWTRWNCSACGSSGSPVRRRR